MEGDFDAADALVKDMTPAEREMLANNLSALSRIVTSRCASCDERILTLGDCVTLFNETRTTLHKACYQRWERP